MVNIPLEGRLGNVLFKFAFAHDFLCQNVGQIRLLVPEKTYFQTETIEILSDLCRSCSHKIEIGYSRYWNFIRKMREKLMGNSPKGLITSFDFLFSINDFSKYSKDTKFKTFRKRNLIVGFLQNLSPLNLGLDQTLTELQHSLFKKLDNCGEYEAIHIRRGDFGMLSKTLGEISLDYYKTNRQEINLPLYICTDEIDERELQKIISMLRPEKLFTPNNSNLRETLRILASAKSLLIANSTLSFWASLGTLQNGGRVFYPSPWYKDHPFDEESVFPKGYQGKKLSSIFE